MYICNISDDWCCFWGQKGESWRKTISLGYMGECRLCTHFWLMGFCWNYTNRDHHNKKNCSRVIKLFTIVKTEPAVIPNMGTMSQKIFVNWNIMNTDMCPFLLCWLDVKRYFFMLLQDTAGSERYEAMSRIYYRSAVAAVLCYDLTDKSSFDRARFWVGELRLTEEVFKLNNFHNSQAVCFLCSVRSKI